MDTSRLCCSEAQVVLLADYVLFLGTCFLLWYSRALLPLKLFTVFLHELSHALAVWLTCNKVTGLEVNADQGGLTHWSAPANRAKFARFVVSPAGYLGSALWGGVILISCGTPETTRAISFVLLLALFIALGYAFFGESNKRDWTLACLCFGMISLLSGLLFLCFYTDWPYRDLLLSKVLLLVGTMNTLFATYDIYEDCVARTIEASDAYKFAELVHCATPVCIGIIWLLISIAMAFLALAFALLRAEEGRQVEGPGDLSEFSRLCIATPALVCMAALFFRCCCSQTYHGKLAPRRTRGVHLEDDSTQDDAEAMSSAPTATDEEVSNASSGDENVVSFTTGQHLLS